MKVAFICPFKLDQLTGTPTRANTTILAASSMFETKVSSLANENLFLFSKKTIKFLKEYRPDIIHCFTTLALVPAFFYKIFFRRKVKVVFEMHGFSWFETKGKENIFKRLIFLILDKFGFLFSNAIIAMSFSQKNFLIKTIKNRNNINVLWGPVNYNIKFTPPAKRDFLEVRYLGNGSFWQGLDHIIGSAKILKDTNGKIKFTLAGFDYSNKEKFPILSNVTYIGKVAHEKVLPFLVESDVLLSPRIQDKVSDLQYPHKLSEYISSGRPVIASDVSDQRKVIEEANCGIVVSQMSAESLADAINKIASLSLDEREEMGRRASVYASENISLEVFSKQLREIYKSILE